MSPRVPTLLAVLLVAGAPASAFGDAPKSLPLGTPVKLLRNKSYRPSGTKIVISNARMIEAHLSDGLNLMTLAIDVADGDAHDSLTLEVPNHAYALWHGLLITLRSADGLHSEAMVVLSRPSAAPGSAAPSSKK